MAIQDMLQDKNLSVCTPHGMSYDLCDDFMQISRKGAASDRPPEEPDNGTSELENANADLRDQAVETR